MFVRLRRLSLISLSLVAGGAAIVGMLAVPVRAQHSAQPGQPQSPQPSPSTGAPQQPVSAPYRGPVIALVQPLAGGTVPQDRPVVMFRFAQGEPNDPIDIRSLAVVVDGIDQTALFKLTAGEAWGPIMQTTSGRGDNTALGLHQLAARICSSRGVCVSTSASITVVAAAAGSPAAEKSTAPTRRQKRIDRVLAAIRKILIH